MWHLKIYKRSQDCLRKFENILQVCLNGFWLGMLNNESLRKIDEIYFSDQKMYCSPEYNKRGFFKWEQEMINTYFKSCGNLLLVAAGGGRETYKLLKMGYDVDAFECHPLLKDYANKLLIEEGLPPCVNIAERDTIPSTNKQYDGAIIGWGAYMHIPGRKNRIEFLKKVSKHLKKESPILISFFRRSEYEKKYKGVVLIANSFRIFLGRDKLEVGDDILPTFVHHFTEKEIEEEFKAAEIKLLYYSTKHYGHAVGKVEKK